MAVNKRHILRLATEYAVQLREAGVLRFECEWFKLDLAPPSEPAEQVSARTTDDIDDSAGLSDRDLYADGFMPGYRVSRRNDA